MKATFAVGAMAVVASMTGCTHPVTTTVIHDALGKPPPASYCAVVGAMLRPGQTYDGQRCFSLSWRLASQPAPDADKLQITWVGNCLEGHVQIHQSFPAGSVTIAVDSLEPWPPPNIGCPAVVRTQTVSLYLPLTGRKLIHAPVVDD